MIATLFLASLLASGRTEVTFENSNYTLSTPLPETQERIGYNYDRFRTRVDAVEGPWFATAIGDVEHYLGRDLVRSRGFRMAMENGSDTPFATRTGMSDYGEGAAFLKLYRLYGGYADARHRVSFGLQKLSLGVGKFWNPTDLFNPKNPLALEPDEVYGAFSLAYTYAPGDLSQATAVVAERKDHTYQYAGRFKGFFDVADAGITLFSNDDARMIGYEVEGELLKTGVELRSEGGWFEDRLLEQRFFQGILGADYTFENSLSLMGEWRHTSRSFERELALGLPTGLSSNLVRSRDYFGISAGFEFDALLYGSVSAIGSGDDGSWFLAPVVTYSLGDDATLGIGGMFYSGAGGSEFGDLHPTAYFNLKVTF